ncbi:MAG: ankyrin repeat domain-containing protein [Cyanobacteria bacterium J06621_11]
MLTPTLDVGVLHASSRRAVNGLNLGDDFERVMNQQEWDMANNAIAAGDAFGVDEIVRSVDVSDYPSLIERYNNNANGWPQKDVIAQLLQHQEHPSLEPIFLDYMQVPITEEIQMFALCNILRQFGGEYDQFERLYQDYDLLLQTLAEVLAKYGLERPPEPEEAEADDVEPGQAPIITEKSTSLTDISLSDPLTKDYGPETLLLVAIERADIVLLEQVLTKGGDINSRIQHKPLTGCTPLMAALQSQQGEIALRLIAAGADVSARRSHRGVLNPEQGQTALSWAMTQPRMDVVEALLAAGARTEAQTKALIDCPDTYGSTPLMRAIQYKNVAFVERLLSAGADFYHPCYEQNRPLAAAISAEGDVAMVRYMLELGDDVNARYHVGYTPLLLAVSKGYVDVVELLLASGADPHAVHLGGGPKAMPDAYKHLMGMTALAIAVEAGRVQMTKVLLTGGADPHQMVEKPDGTSCSVMAFARKNKEKLAKLLE